MSYVGFNWTLKDLQDIQIHRREEAHSVPLCSEVVVSGIWEVVVNSKKQLTEGMKRELPYIPNFILQKISTTQSSNFRLISDGSTILLEEQVKCHQSDRSNHGQLLLVARGEQVHSSFS